MLVPFAFFVVRFGCSQHLYRNYRSRRATDSAPVTRVPDCSRWCLHSLSSEESPLFHYLLRGLSENEVLCTRLWKYPHVKIIYSTEISRFPLRPAAVRRMAGGHQKPSFRPKSYNRAHDQGSRSACVQWPLQAPGLRGRAKELLRCAEARCCPITLPLVRAGTRNCTDTFAPATGNGELWVRATG